MMPATRERMMLVLVISIGFLVPKVAAQSVWIGGGLANRARRSLRVPYWFLSSKEPSQAKGLPPILVFAVEVARWSDGTAASVHQE